MTSSIVIRPARANDIDRLLTLMRGYYRDDGLVFNEAAARCVMPRLLSEAQWGSVMLAEMNEQAIGYAVLCLGFSLELGGNDAYIDELFVDPAYRDRRVARSLLEAVESAARQRGVVALHLEVDRENRKAQHLYLLRAYEKRDRYYLMTKALG